MGGCVAVQLSPSEVTPRPTISLKADSGACLDVPSDVKTQLMRVDTNPVIEPSDEESPQAGMNAQPEAVIGQPIPAITVKRLLENDKVAELRKQESNKGGTVGPHSPHTLEMAKLRTAHSDLMLNRTPSELEELPDLEFPMYGMKIIDFLKLDELVPHGELVEQGLVMPITVKDNSKWAIHFVSHQWLGYTEPDPQGCHLRTMQDVFRRMIEGQEIFASPSDRSAFFEGYTKNNEKWAKTLGLVKAATSTDDMRSFSSTLSEAWMWMDFISIPQIRGYTPQDPEYHVIIANQTAALRCIPEYVARSDCFWVCAPSLTPHSDSGLDCNYGTWEKRGWCRMEEAALMLSKHGNGRPLLITQPLDCYPEIRVLDSMDRLTVHTQRRTAVLTGQFGCCRLRHQRTAPDGSAHTVPCDKDQLRPVLHRLYSEQMALLRKNFLQDPNHGGGFWPSLKTSMRGDKSFFKHLLMRMHRDAILAESVDETDTTHLECLVHPTEFKRCSSVLADADVTDKWFRGLPSWCKSSEKLNDSDLEDYCQSFGVKLDELEHPLGLAAHEGNLPMMRYMIEGTQKECGDVAFVNPAGLTPLIDVSRLGSVTAMKYLLEFPSVAALAHINHKSDGSGVSALSDAAMRGHHKAVRLLLDHGADHRVQRKDGKTALHCAAEQGHAECVRTLLDAGAGKEIKDNDGNTPWDLVPLWMTENQSEEDPVDEDLVDEESPQ